MCKKVIFLFSTFNFPTKKSRLDFERDVRNDILCQNKEQICLEICHTTTKTFFYIDLKNLLRKRQPHVLVFHECSDEVIQKNVKLIKERVKNNFLILYKERPGFKNQITIGEKIERLKNLPMFITAIPAN